MRDVIRLEILQTNAIAIFVLIRQIVMEKRKKMSHEKIERILSTYPPVEGKPGYVWVSKEKTYVKIDVLREAYEEKFLKGPREKAT